MIGRGMFKVLRSSNPIIGPMTEVTGWKADLPAWIKIPLRWMAAVLVTTLLNLMDAATYGRIFFPIHIPLFAEFESLGIAMYLLCTAVSQLVITIGTSFRKGATACAMIENIPFYHAICLGIANGLIDGIGPRGEGKDVMMATILLAYMISSWLVAIIFVTLALLDVDRLIHKFPRVVLVGLMGGIGLFLLQTGLEMAANQTLTIHNAIQLLISSPITVTLWSVGMLMAIVSLMAEMKWGWKFVTPLTCLALASGFYVIYFIQPYDLDTLRSLGWLLSAPSGTSTSIQSIFRNFSLSLVDWKALLSVLPMVAASAIFGSLHVPINCPSYSRLSNQNFSMKRELFTQSVSNAVTSILGFFPNYFVYTNSILFLRAGATHRIVGLFLAGGTAIVLFYGLASLSYIPTTIPLFLIFYLSLCLLFDAIVGSLILCSPGEYAQVIIIMGISQIWGFIPGLVAGVVMTFVYAIVFFKVAKIFSRQHEEKEEIIGNPTVEKAAAGFLNQCLLIQFAEHLCFKNCVEELAKLSYYRIDHNGIIIDFSRVKSIDLNFKEGFLATLQTLRQEEEAEQQHYHERKKIFCLNLRDKNLIRLLRGENMVIFGEGSPRNWIKDQLQGPEDGVEGRDENAFLILETPDAILSPKQAHDFSEWQVRLHAILKTLSKVNGTRNVLLHRGEPVMAKLQSTNNSNNSQNDPIGVLVILKGRIRRKSTVFGPGAWIGLGRTNLAPLHDKSNDCLDGSLAITSTSTFYIPQSALQELSQDNLSFLCSLVAVNSDDGDDDNNNNNQGIQE